MAPGPFVPEMTLDELLLSRRKVTEEQLAEVRRVHAIEGGGWASHFVDAGCLSENELLQLAISETGLPYLPLLRVNLRPELVKEFTVEFLTTFECMPVDEIPPVLTLATPNPFQPELWRSRSSAVREVQLFICRLSEWRECMRRMTQEQKSA